MSSDHMVIKILLLTYAYHSSATIISYSIMMRENTRTLAGQHDIVFAAIAGRLPVCNDDTMPFVRSLLIITCQIDTIVLSIEDKLNYLEQPIPPTLVAPAGQHVAPEILAAHNAWIKGSKEIVGLMLMIMDPEIQRNLELLYAHEMLWELKTIFCSASRARASSDYERFSLLQTGRRANYNMHRMGKTINELHAMLKLHEQTLPKSNAPALNAIQAGKVQKGKKHKKSQSQIAAKGQNRGKGKNKQAYAPKTKIPPPPKRENPEKNSICHECGEIRHWKRNCPQYLAKLLKKKKNAASRADGSGIFVIELNTILNRSWIYDTGCGTHICNTTQGLRASRKRKSGALSLYVGNGQSEAVEAIGAFYLCLPSGLEIVLNNCHYAPSITRGVISISRLYEDGFVNRFVDNTIQVSRNNVVYFSVVPRDEQPIPLAPVAPVGQHVAPKILAAHTAWIKGSKEIVGLMLMSIEPKIQRNLENLHAHEMLLKLKTLFAQQAEHKLLQTMRDFHSCK
nr:hypothetical protein [Tanacetum cinerariifolium]